MADIIDSKPGKQTRLCDFISNFKKVIKVYSIDQCYFDRLDQLCEKLDQHLSQKGEIPKSDFNNFEATLSSVDVDESEIFNSDLFDNNLLYEATLPRVNEVEGESRNNNGTKKEEKHRGPSKTWNDKTFTNFIKCLFGQAEEDVKKDIQKKLTSKLRDKISINCCDSISKFIDETKDNFSNCEAVTILQEIKIIMRKSQVGGKRKCEDLRTNAKVVYNSHTIFSTYIHSSIRNLHMIHQP